MAKAFTNYDSAGLSHKSREDHKQNNKDSMQPSTQALKFVLDYAKASSAIHTKSLKSIILVNN